MNKLENNPIKRAVIYCRVSTGKQVEEGTSLSSQERICTEFAIKNGYTIENIYIEKGESAKTTERTELNKMIAFCTLKKNNIDAVIFYKVDRLARNKDDYGNLRLLLKKYSVEVKSATEHFDDTPAGRFMEGIIANVAQFDNDVRTERTIEGMKEAVRQGRYIWKAPLGYSNSSINGKSNIVQNEKAVFVLECFKEIAKGLKSIEEVRIAFKLKLTKSNGQPICRAQFYNMLKNEAYIGKINIFGEKVLGKYDPIVPEPLFILVQNLIRKKKKVSHAYNTKNPDFPLRRFVKHPDGDSLIGAWCKGSTKKYAYYWFKKKRISFRKEQLDYKFMLFINQFLIDQNAVNLLKILIAQKVILKSQKQIELAEKCEKQISEIKEIKRKLGLKNIQDVISDLDYKEQISSLDTQLDEIQRLLTDSKPRSQQLFDYALNDILKIANTPGELWIKSPYELKVQLQWFNFPIGVYFDGENFRTNEISSIYKAKNTISWYQSTRVAQDSEKLNPQGHTKICHKWPHYLPSEEIEDPLFWEKVYDDVLKLAEIISSVKDREDENEVQES